MESFDHLLIDVRCELQRNIQGISQKVLIQQMPPKVEYSLTEYGVTANKIVDVMCSWGKENIRIRQEQGEEIVLSEEL